MDLSQKVYLSTHRTCEIHNRLEYTNREESDHHRHNDEDHWLDQLLDTTDGDIHLFIIEFRNLNDSITDLSRLFTHTDHRDEEVREEGIVFERFGDFLSIFDILSEEEETLAVDLIAYGTRYDTDCLYYRDTTSE